MPQLQNSITRALLLQVDPNHFRLWDGMELLLYAKREEDGRVSISVCNSVLPGVLSKLTSWVDGTLTESGVLRDLDLIPPYPTK